MVQIEGEFKGEKSKKSLKASRIMTNLQKEYIASLKEKASNGEAVIWTNVGVPMEVMHAMDIPVVFHPYWSALLTAKQMAPHYLNVVNEKGYFRDLCRYCAVPLGYAMENKGGGGPWGGIPKPTAMVIDTADNPCVRIMELMAEEFEVPLYLWDKSTPAFPPPASSCETIEDIEYDAGRETWRVDYAVQETQGLIAFLETITGKKLSEAKLRETMERSNEQFDYIGKVLDLCATVPTPISMGDYMANLISTQFYRGHEYGLEHAKRLYEEIKDRVDNGVAACENEKIRLMYLTVPFWFSPGFYDAFQEKYGAVFAWMAYLPITRLLIRRDLSDPLRALGSRYASYYEHGLLPPWWCNWLVFWAKKFKIDGVIYQVAESCRLLTGPFHLGVQALEKIGIPTLALRADMVDVREWDDQKMKSQVSSFIETLQ